VIEIGGQILKLPYKIHDNIATFVANKMILGTDKPEIISPSIIS
jgi:hypothetical protein